MIFYNKYAKYDETDIILLRDILWRSHRWTHFGESLQNVHHIFLTFLRSGKPIPLKSI